MTSTCITCGKDFDGFVRCSNCGHFYGPAGSPMRKKSRVALVVVGAMVGSVLLFAAFINWQDRKSRRELASAVAQDDLHRIVEQSQLWSAAHDGNCPEIDDLTPSGMIPNTIDPWGTPYRLMCPAKDFTVMTAGEDRQWGTIDDVRITFTEFQAERNARKNDLDGPSR